MGSAAVPATAGLAEAPTGTPSAGLPPTPAAGQEPATDAAATQTPTEAEAATGDATELPAADAMLEPVKPALLTALPGLPTALTADSVPTRRPRPELPGRLFITGLFAPELSTVRNAGLVRPGLSLGVQVEYRLSRRLRLAVGLLSSVKYYRARGADYTWAQPPAYTVERIDATCRITDIPVNLRFDAWQGRRYRAYASAGLSSLLMRDESYQYGYTYYGSYYSRSWQIRNGNNHPFSVLNLAVGLERQLSPRWAVQAEPYLKLPLGGVGQGQVRLSSGGVFLGLKYGL